MGERGLRTGCCGVHAEMYRRCHSFRISPAWVPLGEARDRILQCPLRYELRQKAVSVPVLQASHRVVRTLMRLRAPKLGAIADKSIHHAWAIYASVQSSFENYSLGWQLRDCSKRQISIDGPGYKGCWNSNTWKRAGTIRLLRRSAPDFRGMQKS